MTPDSTATGIRIVHFKDTKVAAFEHHGDPQRIGDSIRKLIEWRKEHHLPPKMSATFNIVYNSHTGKNPEDFRVDLCAATEQDIAPNPFGIVAKIIPAGRCAVLRHVGTDDTLGQAISTLYQQWLPQSGEALRDYPLYFERVVFFPEVPEDEAITDIFLPIK
jgi:AraC family transcriptional regulator